MKKVFFAIPAYKGIRCVPFFESLEETINLCRENGWETGLSILQGCCYVQAARNELCKAFLESECDTLFFLDDDISWDCKDALKLLEMDDDIVAGIYPYKTEEEGYPVVIQTDKNHFPIVREDGCIMAVYIPFGFVAIKRHVIQKVWDSYTSLTYYKPVGCDFVEFRDLFPQGVKNGRWVGEDFAFCDLWNGLGGQIVVFPDITFTHHTDRQAFNGNYHQFLLRRPGGSEYKNTEEESFINNHIDGWLTVAEQRWLYEQSSKYQTVLEVGSFKGKSSVCLLAGKAKKVYCVDHWQKFDVLKDDTAEDAEARYQEFLRNVEPYRGGNGRLVILRQESTQAAKEFTDKSLDMVFIDGGHDEESVKADIDAWLPKTKKLICGHDYSFAWGDVKKVVNEKFGSRVKILDTIWYVEL